jgi:hypothetical protein
MPITIEQTTCETSFNLLCKSTLIPLQTWGETIIEFISETVFNGTVFLGPGSNFPRMKKASYFKINSYLRHSLQRAFLL